MPNAVLPLFPCEACGSSLFRGVFLLHTNKRTTRAQSSLDQRVHMCLWISLNCIFFRIWYLCTAGYCVCVYIVGGEAVELEFSHLFPSDLWENVNLSIRTIVYVRPYSRDLRSGWMCIYFTAPSFFCNILLLVSVVGWHNFIQCFCVCVVCSHLESCCLCYYH